MGDRLHHSLVSFLYYWCVVMLPWKHNKQLNWEELPRNWVPFASWWSTIDVRCSCLCFSRSVSVITLSFKENDSVVLVKELGHCAVFENNGVGFHNLKGKSSHFMSSSLSPGWCEHFSNEIRWGSCICFQLWLNANTHVTLMPPIIELTLRRSPMMWWYADNHTLHCNCLD